MMKIMADAEQEEEDFLRNCLIYKCIASDPKQQIKCFEGNVHDYVD